MSRDQAALVFHLAAKMVQLSERLAKIVKIIPSGKRLIGLPLNTEYRALAADGTTAQGLSPLLAVLDECGQVRGPVSDFVEAITTSQGAHAEPLLIAISTQAPHDADMLSMWIDDARTGADPHTVCHVYEAPKDCELDDRRAWKAANPALGKFRDEKDVERQAQAAIRMPSAEPGFRNLLLNQRVEAISPFVSRSVWASCASEPGEIGSEPVFVGLDLSATSDLTALVAVWKREDGVWGVKPWFWTPESTIFDRSRRDRAPYDVWAKQGDMIATPGATVDYDFVARTVLEFAGEVDLRLLAFDRWRIEQFKAALQRQGASSEFMERMTPFGQGFISMGPALDALESALLNGKMAHAGHPVLTMCAANSVVVKDAAGNRKLDKAKSTGRIDGMVALAMAIGTAAATLAAEDVEVIAEVW
jgi:phage terminase large subunit-like protein